MTTEQTAQQLELAAQIIRTGHPWEWQASDGEWVKPTIRTELHHVISDGLAIRPVLATPPDGRQPHNPDNLTAEQVGVGWRLVCYDDKTTENKLERWMIGEWVVIHGPIGQLSFRHCASTYRLPISVPWPETQPDPYAALKKAHAEGKMIQFKPHGCPWEDSDSPDWTAPLYCYRIKPETPPFQLPPPPPGMQWHREDGWQEGDLPQGMRPLVEEELPMEGDECIAKPLESKWRASNNWMDGSGASEVCHYRTRRPLTFTHAGKTWTWHKPGDPCPVPPNAMVYIITRDNDFSVEPSKAEDYEWDQIGGTGRFAEAIGWRYADEKKTVPLGPEDVKPFTVIRRKGEAQTWHWRTVSYVDAVKVTCGNRGYGWAELASDYERNESLTTGKWNPDAWRPCSKQIDA